ncbi:MAG: hypothetical protein H7066_02090 [Cytophagaceae bacterium]|nr:hypothetical protein [Gemmatimonadaceae bacterium]
MTPPRPSAVVFAANVDRASRYYRDLASMELLHADSTHVVLAIDGFELVIHALPNEPVTAHAPVDVREDAYIKLCLPVDSIVAARERAASLGGHIRDVSAEWEARGFRACDGYDPEGNVIQVRESAGAAPTD